MDKPVTMTENRLAIRRAFLDGKINAVCGYPGIGKTYLTMIHPTFIDGFFSKQYYTDVQASVKVGDTVKVRFEEFGMPDKHVVGRVIHPKRVYRTIKIDERRGQHLSGKDLEEGKVRKFHIEQIVEVL